MQQLNFEKSLALLKKYKIKFVEFKAIKTEKDLDGVKYPIVLKVFSEKIVHKTDKGGVVLDLRNKDEAIKAFKRLKKISAEGGSASGGRNVLMQPMVSQKQEVIIGMKKDPQFGPVIMFGLGGIFVEVIKDVSFRICPVSKKDALEMIKEIKSYKVLTGLRGKQSVNINSLADIIVKLSELSLKEKVEEIDLNPVMVSSKEAFVVDVRVMQ
ncbi:acetate--CoA ligase family protein [Patescibacteria group bacterium]|nr:acetate--CoA ligase family protein [Patescibacteria group bacterium]